MMKQFKIKVDGKEYLVEVEEVGAVESSPAAPVIAKVEPKERTGETKKVETKTFGFEQSSPCLFL
ncbi:MAG TPA: acetyl-CoA carboxylase biotin carboxyl carrier protein subunit, partial [Atribacterota bacterium]|nr:acetyl-CoA carboxylase biotin carboxyl carrier protein subunit [Atribacterota bacterium]